VRRIKLSKPEQKEWVSLSAKSRRHGIAVKRIAGTANVRFSGGVYAQLGTGRATMIMDARIQVKKKRGKRTR